MRGIRARLNTSIELGEIMKRSAAQAIDEVAGFVRDMGESYADWYVGIAEDPMTRLYSYHRVPRHSDLVIAVPTDGADLLP